MTRIVVIGGGIAGVSAAARLSTDADVTLLEGETALAYHASGRSAALIEENYGAPSVQALNRASVEYLAHDNGGVLSPRGLMIVAREHEKEALRADIATLGLSAISVAEAAAMVPILKTDDIRYAAYHADAQDIDTDKLLQGFARQVRQNGGTLLTGQKVRAITRDNGGWQVFTDTADYRCDLLVNAAGAWADEIARCAGIAPMGIIPYRRSMARIAAPGGHDVGTWPLFFGVGESWYAKPDAGALLVSPADEDPVAPHDAWADDMTLAEGLARYQEVVTEEVTRPLATWAGLRSFAPDRTLVLGPEPGAPSFIWCAGQGGYGFQTAPAASQLLAGLVFDRAPGLPAEVVDALKPDRLR
ncbi:MAG: FAD-dependent oxidoreductase [Pseudomonadota bacterium]